MNQIYFPLRTGVIAHSRTGSSYTCSPPVMDTDIDYLVLVEDLYGAINVLHNDGWSLCSGKEGAYDNDENYAVTWYALRKGPINLIMTEEPDWYDRAVEATSICKKHNILDKEDRIIVFRWVRDGGNEDQGVDERAYNEALSRWPL